MQYEYKVIPAPTKPRKGRRVKGAEAKFAFGLETVMNEYAADGWEYHRADILPSEERRGLRSAQTVYRTVLVFRRAVAHVAASAEPVRFVDTPAPSDHDTTTAAGEPTHSDVEEQVGAQEDTAEPARRARFSLIGPARRSAPSGAPPVASPVAAPLDASSTAATSQDLDDDQPAQSEVSNEPR